MFAPLGDENRRGIVARLCSHGPLCVTQVTKRWDEALDRLKEFVEEP
jgi:hypothetical protein